MSIMEIFKNHADAHRGSASGLKRNYEVIPQEKRSWKSHEQIKSAHEIINHMAFWDNYINCRLRNEEPPSQDSEKEWCSQHEELQDENRAHKFFEKMSHEFADIVENASEEDMDREVELPWGTRTVKQVIQDQQWHYAYHLGQLAYIQTQLGDQEMHM